MKANAKSYSRSALFAAALLMSGCASHSYMGVSLEPGGADPAVQALAMRASTGDKQAQLDLGIRFEEGADVARDLNTAKKLYRQAASDSDGTMWVYTPPVGNGTSGRVVPVQSGTQQYGLAEAQQRLNQLNAASRKQAISNTQQNNPPSITPVSSIDDDVSQIVKSSVDIRAAPQFKFDGLIIYIQSQPTSDEIIEYLKKTYTGISQNKSEYNCLLQRKYLAEYIFNLCNKFMLKTVKSTTIWLTDEDSKNGYHFRCKTNFDEWSILTKYNKKINSKMAISDLWQGYSSIEGSSGYHRVNLEFISLRKCLYSIDITEGFK